MMCSFLFLTGKMLSYCYLENTISYMFDNKGPLSDLEFVFCNSFTNSFSLNNSHIKFHKKYFATFEITILSTLG